MLPRSGLDACQWLSSVSAEHPSFAACAPARFTASNYMTVFPTDVCYLTWFAAFRRLPRWRKLHLGLDADRQEIVASKLTADDVGDVSVLADLLDQIDADVASLPAEGVYDGEGAYNAVVERHPAASVVIMPRATAVPSETTTTQRDRHHAAIGEHGRIAWQRSSGYSRRSLVETAMCRYKTIIGRRLQARNLRTQRTEAKIACNVLNRMTWLGMPVTVRTV
jgi:hypothetical protein